MRGFAIVVSVLTACGSGGGEASLTPVPLPPGTLYGIAFDTPAPAS